ncbi:MAG: hypothetical protein U9R79_10370 [Armatimonadota bacterium]|nr:hypothetical protein [Armatimonadota bacterium]
MCAQDFEEIRILGLASSQPEDLRDNSGWWMVHFELSAKPPGEWKEIFQEIWRFGGPLSQPAPEFTTAHGVPCLVVRSHSDQTDAVQAQLDHAKRKVHDANERYQQLLEEKESKRAAQEAAKSQAKREQEGILKRLREELNFD